MNRDGLIAEVGLGAGHLSLYPGRLVHQSEAVTETVPLAHLASVRICFEREAGKLGGAIALGVAAVLLLVISSPLQAWLVSLAGKVAEPGRRESLDSVLHAVFSALAGFAGALPTIAAVLLAAAAALAALWVYGRTTLTLCFAATERAMSLRGRNVALREFAEALAARIADRTQAR